MSTADTITIKVDGEERELFMSFGLLNDLSKLVLSPEQVALFVVDPDTRTTVRAKVLAKRKPSGKLIGDLPDPDDFDVSVADTEKLLAWAMEHVTDFFLRSMNAVVGVTKKLEDKVTDLASSANGSKG